MMTPEEKRIAVAKLKKDAGKLAIRTVNGCVTAALWVLSIWFVVLGLAGVVIPLLAFGRALAWATLDVVRWWAGVWGLTW